MKSKVYDLMNWPEIEGITYADTTQPGELLGGHVCKDGYLIQIFRPDAVEVSVTALQKKYECEKVDEAGYFAVLIPSKKAVKYTVTVENVNGEVQTYEDPYSFAADLKPADKKKFLAGTAFNAYEFLGAQICETDGTEGTLYSVWAPNARRVSVIGDFNHWDGRICQMNSDDSGIFRLFVPGVCDTKYCFEVKLRDGRTVRKSDPYYTGDNFLDYEYIWDDNSWNADFKQDAPLAICELDVEALIADDCVEKVKKLGFNCVELNGINPGADEEDGIAAGNLYVDSRVGADRLKSIIGDFHKNNIAVIMDCNLAYIRHGLGCIAFYDGIHLYDSGDIHLPNRPNVGCSSYDYKKPQVRSYLFSTVDYWIKQFHVDGIRLSEVASMLYLDFGKNPGEWTPNMYGGKENLEAVELIKDIRKYIDKLDRKVLMIAEESSIWTMVTGDVKNDGLGFDYQWNNGWKSDFIEFYGTDPLFRKGKYEKLTHSMFYQYSENFIVEFSRDGLGGDETLINLAPVPDNLEDSESVKLAQAHVRSAIGYMYAYPGKKLVNIRDCRGIEDYIAKLNKIYFEHKELWEQDNVSDGFEWVNDSRAAETVLAFARKSADGKVLLCVANFTPVDREEFRLGVPFAGKYTDIVTGKTFKTVTEEWDGKSESAALDVAGLSMSFFTYEPYTEVEKKESAIISEAKAAFAEAQQKAETAKKIDEEAKEAARVAKEAEKRARKAAEDADKASREAHRQADEARRRCEQIEAETKKKLEELKKGTK
jgi:1,4-alpha-glucan branching enzyme